MAAQMFDRDFDNQMQGVMRACIDELSGIYNEVVSVMAHTVADHRARSEHLKALCVKIKLSESRVQSAQWEIQRKGQRSSSELNLLYAMARKVIKGIEILLT